MELTLVPLLLPAMRSAFDLSLGEVAWIFNSYSVAVAVGVLVGGLFGDTFKTAKVFAFGVAAFFAGSVLLAISANGDTLIAARMVQGFGAGVFSPLVPVLLTQAAPDKPGRMLILWGSLAGYVAAVAPLAYSGILVAGNWSLAFVFIASIAALSLLFLVWLPPADDPSAGTRDRPEYHRIFSAGHLWLTLAYVFITYGAITYFLFRLPLWLTEAGVQTTYIGFVLSTFWLTFSGLSALLRNKVDQHHVLSIMAVAPVLIGAGVLLSYNISIAVLVGAAMLVGSGLACSNAPSTQMILRHAPPGLSAMSASLDITLARLGGIVTVALLAETGVSFAGIAISVACVVAALFAFAICRPAVERA
ncbi:MFS transporter [uncultured Tateyamaria sp.]|nr:MFS transporter [uncultured Tateyamaria sp.]